MSTKGWIGRLTPEELWAAIHRAAEKTKALAESYAYASTATGGEDDAEVSDIKRISAAYLSQLDWSNTTHAFIQAMPRVKGCPYCMARCDGPSPGEKPTGVGWYRLTCERKFDEPAYWIRVPKPLQ